MLVLVLCAMLHAALAGCVGDGTNPIIQERAIGVPAALERSPDLPLPLSERDANVVRVYLGGGRPAESWEATLDDFEEEFLAIPSSQYAAFEPIIDKLRSGAFDMTRLSVPGGALGSLFDRDLDERLVRDSRLVSQSMPDDQLVRRRGDYYFVFSKRFPAGGIDGVCPVDSYCRLLLIPVKSTQSR